MVDLLEQVQLELKEIRDRADSALRKLASLQNVQVFENVDLNGPTSEQNGPLEPVCNEAPESIPDQQEMPPMPPQHQQVPPHPQFGVPPMMPPQHHTSPHQQEVPHHPIHDRADSAMHNLASFQNGQVFENLDLNGPTSEQNAPLEPVCNEAPESIPDQQKMPPMPPQHQQVPPHPQFGVPPMMPPQHHTSPHQQEVPHHPIHDGADSALHNLASFQNGQVFENLDLNGPTSEQNGPLEPVCNEAPESIPDQQKMPPMPPQHQQVPPHPQLGVPLMMPPQHHTSPHQQEVPHHPIHDRADSAMHNLASFQNGQVFENVDLNGPTSEQNGPLEPVCNEAPESIPDQQEMPPMPPQHQQVPPHPQFGVPPMMPPQHHTSPHQQEVPHHPIHDRADSAMHNLASFQNGQVFEKLDLNGPRSEQNGPLEPVCNEAPESIPDQQKMPSMPPQHQQVPPHPQFGVPPHPQFGVPPMMPAQHQMPPPQQQTPPMPSQHQQVPPHPQFGVPPMMPPQHHTSPHQQEVPHHPIHDGADSAMHNLASFRNGQVFEKLDLNGPRSGQNGPLEPVCNEAPESIPDQQKMPPMPPQHQQCLP
ncbi:hypothetical protein QR680_011227 [Steinernema hermaphroditum]|uniref:Uncharacterized protein n=1 Tax=Steinernema hermaphroditum TaxID=289476 RepID=A0AA39IRL8_9BILA|nr:hypothetical protein QR680_011227 [Steinernema hermaphroditum]